MDQNPVQDVQIFEEYKKIRADFERMARLNNVPLKPEELDQMAMGEAGERLGSKSAGESPEALRAIHPANRDQAQRLQRLLHTRVADLAQEHQEAPAENALQQFGERGAQNVAGLVGGVANTLGAKGLSQDAQEFSAGIEPSALGGNRLAQTAGDVAGGYAGSYPLAAGIEGALGKVPLLGKALQAGGSRLAQLAPEGAGIIPTALRGAAQALPKEVAMGETFQGLTGGPKSLGTLGGQANALGMAAAGTGLRGVSALDRPPETPEARAQKLLSTLRPELGERATLNSTEPAGRPADPAMEEPTFQRRAREADVRSKAAVPLLEPENIDVNAPFEENAVPNNPRSTQDQLADIYSSLGLDEARAVAKGEAPEQGAGFRALRQARARKLKLGGPSVTESLNRASKRGAGRYRQSEDDTGGQPE